MKDRSEVQFWQRKALLVPILAMVLALIWLRPMDSVAERYVETGFQRALTTFAAARGLNALISLLQGTSFNLQIGVGAAVHPGAVLDPLDDLVEQFSVLMLAATLSFATQRLLIEVFGAWPVGLLLTALLLGWSMFHWRRRPSPLWLAKLALGLLCLRLAVPVVSIGSEATYRLLLASGYEASQAQIQTADSADAESPPGESLADRARRWWNQGADIGKKIDALKARADGVVEHIIKLAAVFIVQTVVLPLLFLWLMLRLYRALTGPSLLPPAPRPLLPPMANRGPPGAG